MQLLELEQVLELGFELGLELMLNSRLELVE
jgi:hypothetical protein